MVLSYDPQPSSNGLAPNAQEAIPGDPGLAVPEVDDSAALAEDVDAEQAAPESAEPFDYESLDDELRSNLDQYYKSQFDASLAEAMRSRDQENYLLNGHKELLTGQVSSLTAGLAAAMQAIQRHAQEQGDELMMYRINDEVQNAINGTTANVNRSRAAFAAHIQNQEIHHNAEVQRLSVDEQGNRLFEVGDPDINQAFQTYLAAARRDPSRGTQNTPEAQRGWAAWQRYQAVLEQKRIDGRVRLQMGPQRAKNAQANEKVNTRRERGPQAKGTRPSAGVAVDTSALVKKAWEDHPTDERARVQRLNELMAAAGVR